MIHCDKCGYPAGTEPYGGVCPSCRSTRKWLSQREYKRQRDARRDEERRVAAEFEASLASPPAGGGAAPAIVGDRIPKYFDYALGCEVDSRSQQNRLMKERGLRWKSVREQRQQFGGMEKPPSITSYGGQKNRGSRRGGVRTGTGQRVI